GVPWLGRSVTSGRARQMARRRSARLGCVSSTRTILAPASSVRCWHEVRDRYPAVLRRRRVRSRGLPWLPGPGRGTRLRKRLDPHRYVARFTEGVKVMKALWTEPSVTFHGEFWQLDNAAMEPKPFKKPYPRLWFGGASEPALRRAVRMGDGFFGAGSSPTDK